jgi:hypothetical protein
MSQNNGNSSQIRAHLQGKSTEYLVDLLVDLIQAAEEPLRRRFWERLAPPMIATTDLRYASPEEFLAELNEFVEAVENGEYYDEAALEYYGEDPFDREYRRDKYSWYEEFDPDAHEGLNTLGEFLEEADSYIAPLYGSLSCRRIPGNGRGDGQPIAKGCNGSRTSPAYCCLAA